MKLKYVAIFLVLLCCLMGAASAAEDVSTDVVDASADAVAVDAVSEDVSDSVESIDDEVEPAVVESASAQEENDDVKLEASVDNEVLADEYPSSDSDLLNVLLDNLDYDDVTIHLSSGTWSIPNRELTMASETDVYIIGEDCDNTIFTSYGITQQGSPENYKGTFTWENITFYNVGMSLYGINYKFINCKFINYALELNEKETPAAAGNYYLFDYTFVNCDFVNYTQNVMTGHNYTNIVISNCNFENITSDTILSTTCTGSGTRYDDNWQQYTDKSSVSLKDCTFTNINVKGIAKATADAVNNVITENNYDFNTQDTLVDGDYTYIDVPVIAVDTTLVADIDDAGNLLVSLTDAGGNAIANGKVLISINGAESVSRDLGADGTLSIALSDLTDATGKLNIAVSFEETDDYKGSSDTISTVLVVKTVTETIDPVATAITASDITATAKIGKTLSITLKDANGNPLVNKAVQVTVNGKTSTVKTDSKGVAKVTVNYAKAGTYYYTFTYLGDNDYKASLKPVKVTVNKQATKATFAKKTFKVKATKKISFTLKDSKGKAIAKKKITFKVNGKTYTAKTNSKGVATVKIVIKKKGKYTATAKFAGDTTYKAISKKAKITVK